MWKDSIISSHPDLVDWTHHKAIVIQSDDWGLCNYYPDLEAFQSLWPRASVASNTNGALWAKSTLESPEDLERLFQILRRYRGGDGRNVVFQAAYVMAAPDFESIEADGFRSFRRRVIPDVPGRWQRGDFVAKSKQGMKEGMWHPIYHGFTHFDYVLWLKLLRSGNREVLREFQHQCIGIDNGEYSPSRSYEEEHRMIAEGTDLFYRVFGLRARAAVAPNYIWQSKTEKALAQHGIRVIEAKNYQQLTRTLFEKVQGKIKKYAGKKSSDKPWQICMGDINQELGLCYLCRNVKFEPRGQVKANGQSIVEQAYQGITTAWQRNEPAILYSHRINYVYLDKEVVERNLEQLNALLAMIQSRHPDAVYLTDEEVAQLYQTGHSVMQFDGLIVSRNYTGSPYTFDVKIPEHQKVVCVTNLRDGSTIEYRSQNGLVTFVSHRGDYAIRLAREH